MPHKDLDGDDELKKFNDDQRKYRFLNLLIKPGRLRSYEVAWMLGVSLHDIPILMGIGLLRPLGSPPPKATKYFCSVQVEALRVDTKWKARACDHLVQHWQKKR